MIESPLDDDFRDDSFEQGSFPDDSFPDRHDAAVPDRNSLAGESAGDERMSQLEARLGVLLRRSQPELETGYGLRTRVLRAASQARLRQEVRWKRRCGIITGVLSASLMLLTPLVWGCLTGNLGIAAPTASRTQNPGIPNSAFGPGGGTFEWSLVDFSFADREIRSKRFRGDL